MDYEEAEHYYGLAYGKKPHDDMIVMCYSNILKHNDKHKEAKKILNKSLKSNPNGTYKRYFELA
jgi:predicted Zn-dependent protease